MTLEIVGAHLRGERPGGHVVTDGGLVPLEGNAEELGRLAEVMQQVAALAPLNQTEKVWIEDVRVGDAVVKLGLRRGGEALFRIVRRHRRD